ncbi:MAG: exosome complex protein Rrp42 [bacterium]|nr:exosome complex protein Rrp42 [bacterium]
MDSELKKHMLKFLVKGVRYDGRKLDEFRKITVTYDVTKNAEGSARVTVGDTDLIAGVKTAVEKPYPDTPDKGNIMVGAELSPMSSPDFESGPPSDKAVEVARVIDRGIRESQSLDVKTLCIEKAEKVWTICVDIHTVNAAGNLIDAGALAAIAALKNAKMVKYDGEKVDYKVKTKDPLPLKAEPIAITVAKIGQFLVVDPTNEEEDAADARLTVSSTKDGKLCAMQKGGQGTFTIEEINKIVDLALVKAKELAKYL